MINCWSPILDPHIQWKIDFCNFFHVDNIMTFLEDNYLGKLAYINISHSMWEKNCLTKNNDNKKHDYFWKYTQLQNNTFAVNLEWKKESFCKIFMQYDRKTF